MSTGPDAVGAKKVVTGGKIGLQASRAEAARRIDAAVAAVLAEGRARPVDLGGADGTEAVTRAVVEALGQSG